MTNQKQQRWDEYDSTFEAWTRSVLVRNLSFNVRSTHINEIFSTFGQVQKVELCYIKGHSAGIAVVHFTKHSFAVSAAEQMNNGNIDGINVSVELSNPRKTVDECHRKNQNL